MVAKRRTHNRFSCSVRMKRSATAVAFGLPHEARRAVDAEEGDLLLEIVSAVVGAVVVPQSQPARDAVADAPEVFAHARADRLQGLEAGPVLGGMQTAALGRAVINGHEDTGRPLSDGHRGRHVRTPHHVGRLSGDGPVVRRRPVRVTRTGRGLEVVLSKNPIDAVRRADSTLDARRVATVVTAESLCSARPVCRLFPKCCSSSSWPSRAGSTRSRVTSLTALSS